MRRVISMPPRWSCLPVSIRPQGLTSKHSSSKYYEAGPLCCAYAIVRPFIAILTSCPV
jgi:hypothetical protein